MNEQPRAILTQTREIGMQEANCSYCQSIDLVVLSIIRAPSGDIAILNCINCGEYLEIDPLNVDISGLSGAS